MLASAYCRRVLGCHPLPSCIEEVLGIMWSLPKQVAVDEVGCLNRQNSAGPATDILDHMARSCYLPRGL